MPSGGEHEFRCWVGMDVGEECARVALRLLDAMQQTHPEAGSAVSHGSGGVTLVFGIAAIDIRSALMLGWQIASAGLATAGVPVERVGRFELESVPMQTGALRVKVDYYADDYAASSDEGRAVSPGLFVATLLGRSTSGSGATVAQAVEELAAELVPAFEDEDLAAVAAGGDEIQAAIARHAMAGDLVATLMSAADGPVLADEPRSSPGGAHESTDALQLNVIELICPSCGAGYEAVGAAEDLTSLSCWFCPSMLSELYADERFAAPEREPVPGRPVVTLLFRPEVDGAN